MKEKSTRKMWILWKDFLRNQIVWQLDYVLANKITKKRLLNAQFHLTHNLVNSFQKRKPGIKTEWKRKSSNFFRNWLCFIECIAIGKPDQYLISTRGIWFTFRMFIFRLLEFKEACNEFKFEVKSLKYTIFYSTVFWYVNKMLKAADRHHHFFNLNVNKLVW